MPKVLISDSLSEQGVKILEPWLIVDKFSVFFTMVTCLGGALATLLAGGYLPEHKLDRGEFYPLIIFSTLGCVVLTRATPHRCPVSSPSSPPPMSMSGRCRPVLR